MARYWQTSRRKIALDRTFVMGILNVTPDSFSDGGKYFTVDNALRHAERLVTEGADILDIGGESTRPGGKATEAEEEIRRVVPVVEEVCRRFEAPVSVDTWKSKVADAALDAGAEIVNDISGLRFDPSLIKILALKRAGTVLMHSRGDFSTMHKLEPTYDIISDVSNEFHRCISLAEKSGIRREQIVLDVGIGFGKSLEQNLFLIARLAKIREEFPDFPLLLGASRKSFIGKVLGDIPPEDRLFGSIAAATLAVWNSADIVRVHDVKQTVDAVRFADAVKDRS